MKNFKNFYSELDTIVLKIINTGFKFVLLIWLVSSLLLTYYLNYNYIFLYYLGLTIFKLGTYLLLEFIICGFAMDKIKKQLF